MMKNIKILILCAFILVACAPAANQPKKSTPTQVPLPTSTATVTPTQPTPTFTSTPTLIGYKSPTPTLEDTATPTPTVTSAFDGITPSTPTPYIKMDGFVSVKLSSDVFYLGKECHPNSVKFTVQVVNPAKAEFVLLSTRFVSRSTGAESKWEGITMQSDGRGMFTYELFPQEMKYVDSFIDPWVQFQLVATDKDSEEVGRTGVFDERLSLLACVLTPTPTPSITPTVLKP